MSDILILIPAAGASSRMGGRDKLLERIGGTPILARQVERALATGAQVFVPVSRDHPQRLALLQQISQPRLTVAAIDGREGMAASIREAARRATVAGPRAVLGLLVLPADMPELDTEDLAQVIGSFRKAPETVHRATSENGTPGHPVVFPRRLFDALGKLHGDEGARNLLKTERLRLVALPDDHALTDLDTPEDWAAWRQKNGEPEGSGD